ILVSDTDEYQKRYAEGMKAYQEWQGKVFARDNTACQKCGCTIRGRLYAARINDSRSGSRYDLSNGITICKSECKDFFTAEYRNKIGLKAKEMWNLLSFEERSNRAMKGVCTRMK